MGRRISARRTHRIGNLSAPTRTVSLASKQTIGHCTVDTSRSTTSSRITTEGHHGGLGIARVKTYGDVFEEYEWHPEPKCADANGEPVGKQTVGLLHRRHITIDHVIYIGRESNQLEVVEAGVVRASDGAYTEYPDPRRDYWQRAVVPALKQISLKAWQRDTGKSAVILIDARRGRRRPHAKHRALLIMYARRRGLLS